MGQPVDIALGTGFVSNTNPLPVAIMSGGVGGGGGSSAPSDSSWVDNNGVYFIYEDSGGGVHTAVRIDTWTSFTPAAPVKPTGQPTLGQAPSAGSLSVVLSSDGPFTTNFGAKADAAATDATSAWSLIALLKGLLSRFLPYSITQTIYTISNSVTVIPANPNRRYLAWMVTGASDVTIAPGTSGVTIGAGMIYQASAAGKQGGSDNFQGTAARDPFQCITSAAGSTLTVWEGV